MLMVFTAIETARFMALRTERVAFCDQLSGMYIMAVTAGHTLSVHFTLQKRTHDKNFVVYLAIGKVEPLVEQGQTILIMKRGQRFCVSQY